MSSSSSSSSSGSSSGSSSVSSEASEYDEVAPREDRAPSPLNPLSSDEREQAIDAARAILRGFMIEAVQGETLEMAQFSYSKLQERFLNALSEEMDEDNENSLKEHFWHGGGRSNRDLNHFRGSNGEEYFHDMFAKLHDLTEEQKRRLMEEAFDLEKLLDRNEIEGESKVPEDMRHQFDRAAAMVAANEMYVAYGEYIKELLLDNQFEAFTSMLQDSNNIGVAKDGSLAIPVENLLGGLYTNRLGTGLLKQLVEQKYVFSATEAVPPHPETGEAMAAANGPLANIQFYIARDATNSDEYVLVIPPSQFAKLQHHKMGMQDYISMLNLSTTHPDIEAVGNDRLKEAHAFYREKQKIVKRKLGTDVQKELESDVEEPDIDPWYLVDNSRRAQARRARAASNTTAALDADTTNMVDIDYGGVDTDTGLLLAQIINRATHTVRLEDEFEYDSEDHDLCIETDVTAPTYLVHGLNQHITDDLPRGSRGQKLFFSYDENKKEFRLDGCNDESSLNECKNILIDIGIEEDNITIEDGNIIIDKDGIGNLQNGALLSHILEEELRLSASENTYSLVISGIDTDGREEEVKEKIADDLSTRTFNFDKDDIEIEDGNVIISPEGVAKMKQHNVSIYSDLDVGYESVELKVVVGRDNVRTLEQNLKSEAVILQDFTPDLAEAVKNHMKSILPSGNHGDSTHNVRAPFNSPDLVRYYQSSLDLAGKKPKYNTNTQEISFRLPIEENTAMGMVHPAKAMKQNLENHLGRGVVRTEIKNGYMHFVLDRHAIQAYSAKEQIISKTTGKEVGKAFKEAFKEACEEGDVTVKVPTMKDPQSPRYPDNYFNSISFDSTTNEVVIECNTTYAAEVIEEKFINGAFRNKVDIEDDYTRENNVIRIDADGIEKLQMHFDIGAHKVSALEAEQAAHSKTFPHGMQISEHFADKIMDNMRAHFNDKDRLQFSFNPATQSITISNIGRGRKTSEIQRRLGLDSDFRDTEGGLVRNGSITINADGIRAYVENILDVPEANLDSFEIDVKAAMMANKNRALPEAVTSLKEAIYRSGTEEKHTRNYAKNTRDMMNEVLESTLPGLPKFTDTSKTHIATKSMNAEHANRFVQVLQQRGIPATIQGTGNHVKIAISSEHFYTLNEQYNMKLNEAIHDFLDEVMDPDNIGKDIADIADEEGIPDHVLESSDVQRALAHIDTLRQDGSFLANHKAQHMNDNRPQDARYRRLKADRAIAREAVEEAKDLSSENEIIEEAGKLFTEDNFEIVKEGNYPAKGNYVELKIQDPKDLRNVVEKMKSAGMGVDVQSHKKGTFRVYGSIDAFIYMHERFSSEKDKEAIEKERHGFENKLVNGKNVPDNLDNFRKDITESYKASSKQRLSDLFVEFADTLAMKCGVPTEIAYKMAAELADHLDGSDIDNETDAIDALEKIAKEAGYEEQWADLSSDDLALACSLAEKIDDLGYNSADFEAQAEICNGWAEAYMVTVMQDNFRDLVKELEDIGMDHDHALRMASNVAMLMQENGYRDNNPDLEDARDLLDVAAGKSGTKVEGEWNEEKGANDNDAYVALQKFVCDNIITDDVNKSTYEDIENSIDRQRETLFGQRMSYIIEELEEIGFTPAEARLVAAGLSDEDVVQKSFDDAMESAVEEAGLESKWNTIKDEEDLNVLEDRVKDLDTGAFNESIFERHKKHLLEDAVGQAAIEIANMNGTCIDEDGNYVEGRQEEAETILTALDECTKDNGDLSKRKVRAVIDSYGEHISEEQKEVLVQKLANAHSRNKEEDGPSLHDVLEEVKQDGKYGDPSIARDEHGNKIEGDNKETGQSKENKPWTEIDEQIYRKKMDVYAHEIGAINHDMEALKLDQKAHGKAKNRVQSGWDITKAAIGVAIFSALFPPAAAIGVIAGAIFAGVRLWNMHKADKEIDIQNHHTAASLERMEAQKSQLELRQLEVQRERNDRTGKLPHREAPVLEQSKDHAKSTEQPLTPEQQQALFDQILQGQGKDATKQMAKSGAKTTRPAGTVEGPEGEMSADKRQEREDKQQKR